MQYMLLLYANEKAGDAVPRADMDRWMDKMREYQDTLTRAVAFISTTGLARSYEATTVHLENGAAKVEDGPYAQTPEQLGGFYIIEAPDMAAAQKWAVQCPGAIWGKIEVRPFATYNGAAD